MASRGVSKVSKPIEASFFDLDDDDGWQDMPVVRDVDPNLALDEEDKKKYHYTSRSLSLTASTSTGSGGDPGARGNATGAHIDIDERGQEWREKLASNEDDYTRLKLDDDEDADDAYLRTKYLFDEDKAMTPLSQMQQTKTLLTEAQRIAYVGLCSLVARELSRTLSAARRKELSPAIKGLDLWRMRIMGRLYYHMELETDEQKMIESLGDHGVEPMDLVPALMTTRIVANPEYDPKMATQRKADEAEAEAEAEAARDPPPPAYTAADSSNELSIQAATSPPSHSPQTTPDPNPSDEPPSTPTAVHPSTLRHTQGGSLLNTGSGAQEPTTHNVMQQHEATTIPGVTTALSSSDENVTLDIRWTVLCDLFLILIADSVYDSRSRTLLENVAAKLGLGWIDVVRFEKRVTDALEIQEGVERLEQREVIEGRSKAAQKKRYVMMGLATLGGGLVIGLSAGLLAPVIGVGIGAALSTVGITGTSAFLGGVGGAAVITTGGVLTGSGIAARGMSRRTRQVRTFDLLPLHNNKRVSCIITVPGFMASAQEDVRLPFSVLDSVVGDVFSVRWEPEMMGELGNALKILTSEVLSQLGTTVLQATVMTALMSALQWPILLTKLGYLIDNPWSNALDRAAAAGAVLADVLLNRSLGVRPITLVGFSLGARVIFYALLELAKQKAFGIVQDVFLLGGTFTASQKSWLTVRSVVAGRFINAFARNDWVLNYLFRATTGGGTVAGLRPIDGVPGLENVDVTDKIAGHMSYRVYMPIILDQLGFPVTATYFDEPEEPDMEYDREVIREEELAAREAAKKKRFLFRNKASTQSTTTAAVAGAAAAGASPSKSSASAGKQSAEIDDDDLPERLETPASQTPTSPPTPGPSTDEAVSRIPAKAGFDFKAIAKAIGKDDLNPSSLPMIPAEAIPAPATRMAEGAPDRTGSAPPPLPKTPLPPTPSDIPTPTNRPSPLPSHPSSSSDAVPLPSIFQRSLSLDGSNRTTLDDQETTPTGSSLFSNTNRLAAPNWPPPSSMLSFASSEGSVWGASSSNDYSSSFSSSSTFANPGPLKRQQPPALSFGALNGNAVISAPPTASAPQLSFGSLEGDVSTDGRDSEGRDAWAPKPIGLDAAIARKTNYQLNPWET